MRDCARFFVDTVVQAHRGLVKKALVPAAGKPGASVRVLGETCVALHSCASVAESPDGEYMGYSTGVKSCGVAFVFQASTVYFRFTPWLKTHHPCCA